MGWRVTRSLLLVVVASLLVSTSAGRTLQWSLMAGDREALARQGAEGPSGPSNDTGGGALGEEGGQGEQQPTGQEELELPMVHLVESFSSLFAPGNLTAADFDLLYDHVMELEGYNGTRTFSAGCPPAGELFEDGDVSGDGLLSVEEVEAQAAEMFAMLHENCRLLIRGAAPCRPRPSTTAEAWGYGFLSVIIISLISLVGIVFLPVRESKFRSILLSCMVAFDVGALLGDSLFHLLPIITRIHAHDSKGSGDQHARSVLTVVEADWTYLWPLVVVCASIVIFVVLERFIHSMHDHFQGTPHPHDSKNGSIMLNDKADDLALDEPSPGFNLPKETSAGTVGSATAGQIKAYGWLNLIADFFHNFTVSWRPSPSFLHLNITLHTGWACIGRCVGNFSVAWSCHIPGCAFP
jgi:hypothetical protein